MKTNLYFFLGLIISALLVSSCTKDNNPVAVQSSFSSQTINWVTIPGGYFRMGDTDRTSDAWPVHPVYLDSYQMSATEVTFAQYDAFCDSTGHAKPSDNFWGRGNRPAIWVTWNDAKAYCNWLTKQLGDTVRLPTEAEWEYAARGGANLMKTDSVKFAQLDSIAKSESRVYLHPDTLKFAGTYDINLLSNYAWYEGSATQPVGAKLPNSLGLYDMSGNVWEWCNDLYGAYTKDTITIVSNPQGASILTGVNHVIRGGAWGWEALYCRTNLRMNVPTTTSEFNLGFRVVRKMKQSLKKS